MNVYNLKKRDELEGELQMVYQEESIFDGILHH